ncbi:MAG: ComEC family competence protein, partial [Deltaproteobacteria bacterium]
MEAGTNRHQPMRRPLVALAAAMVAGAWAAGRISAPAWTGLLAAFVLAAAAVAARHLVEGQIRFLFYMLAFLALGWSAGRNAAPVKKRTGGLVEKPQAGVLEARALGGNDWLQDGFRLEVEALAFGPPGRLGPARARRLLVRVFDGDRKHCPVVLPGDVLLLDGRLSPLRGYRNPGGFDRRAFLLHRGISGEFRVRDCQRILIRRPAPLSVKSVTESLRQDAARMFLSSGGKRAGGLVAAMTLGLRGLVSPEDSRLFSSAGMAHLLAVSGLHVGMIALGGFLALSWLLLRFTPLARRHRTSRIAAAIMIPACIFYALLAGAGYPAVRAATVASAFLLAHALGRRTDALNLLALAAMVVVAIWPNSIYSPSFQLSFTAALGLVLLVPGASRLLRAPVGATGELPLRSRLHRRLVQAACVTVVAWAVTAPLGLYHFNQLSLAGPLVNLVAVPLAAWLVVPLGLAAVVLLAAWPAAAAAVASAASGTAGWLLGVAEISKALPALWLPSPPAITVAGIYLAVLLALGPGRRRRLVAAAIAVCAMAAWPV